MNFTEEDIYHKNKLSMLEVVEEFLGDDEILDEEEYNLYQNMIEDYITYFRTKRRNRRQAINR